MSLPLALIVEDNPQLNQICEVALKNEFETVCLHDGEQALEYLENHTPALIVLDLRLKHTSGETVLKAIRKDPGKSDVKIILTTADVQMAEMLFDHADIVLQKPVSPVQLRNLAIRLCTI